jgi:predicted amidohydrolase
MKSINLVLVQFDILWENPKGNFTKLDQLFEKIDKDIDLIILPEMFATGFTMHVNKFAKPVGIDVFNWLQDKSEEINKIIIGSILFQENEKYFNRMFWMRPDRSFDFYDKRHLFQMGNEHQVMTAGTNRVIVPYKGLRFMLQICYDLRFPVWVKNKYDKKENKHDYDVILYIANWPEVRKQAYLSLLKARAIENQAYVIWVNRIGKDSMEINHSGDTQLIDPMGTVQKKLDKDKEDMLYARIDKEHLFTIRNNFKVGLDWDN